MSSLLRVSFNFNYGNKQIKDYRDLSDDDKLSDNNIGRIISVGIIESISVAFDIVLLLIAIAVPLIHSNTSKIVDV